MACLGGRANLGSRPRTLVELPCHLTRSTPRLLPIRKENSSDAQRRRREAPASRGERSLRAKARRSLSPRERSAGAESGERSSPHPGEPLAGAAKPQIPRRRGATWYSRKTRYTGFFEARKTQNEWRAFVNWVFPYRR